MQVAAQIASVMLYSTVGVISLAMAVKCLTFNRFIPFHEKAAGVPLERLDQRIQNVILGLMRTTGLGFLVVGMLLLVVPIVCYLGADRIVELGIPFICAIYCLGLFLANYRLHKQSGVATPWRGSLVSAVMIFAGIIITAV